MHNAAFEALGLDWVYTAFRVPKGGGAAAVHAMRALGLAGMSVTMPHKADAATAVDVLGPVAAALGVVNTVAWSSDRPDVLVGESTDGAGFLDAVADEGLDVRGSRCVVFGAGGAARSVTHAAAGAGARALTVVARDPIKAQSCAALAGTSALTVLATDRAAVEEAIGACDLVVNATPVGMGASPASRVELGPPPAAPMGAESGWFHASQLVVDLVYHPARTLLMDIAAAGGARSVNGLGMLIHQARRQVELWTGRLPPVEVLVRAVEDSIKEHNSESR